MGAADFFVFIEMVDDRLDFIQDIFNQNKLFKECIPYFLSKEKNELHIQGALGCFFPITNIIFHLFQLINETNPIKRISSLGAEKAFDFSDESEFFHWMYIIWKRKLEYFYEAYGAFLIKPSDYYNMPRSFLKMRKKYFIKYSNKCNHTNKAL